MIAHKLEFEDHGQDFLYFIVQGGAVVEAGPFQSRIWVGKKVLDREFTVGQRIEMVLGDKIRNLNYPIKSVAVLNDYTPKSQEPDDE